MARRRIFFVTLTLAMLGLVGCSDEGTDQVQRRDSGSKDATQTEAPESTGRIAFMRGDPASDEGSFTFIVNPDGSDERPLYSDGNSEFPRWSPDGTEIHIFCCGDGMIAHFVDPATGDFLRSLPPPDPTLETYCGGAWSPDGKRIACLSFGVDDPSLNGIYSVRVSDGGGLTRITSNPGGEDLPGDYSPDGRQLVFMRLSEDDRSSIFVTDLDGSTQRQISPRDLLIDDTFGGTWSPDGTQILFVARASPDHHKAIWVVNPDGSSPHLLPITPACGDPFSDPDSAGCYSPAWSPDGERIVFTRSSPDGQTENIYSVNVDGTELLQVTDDGADDGADWGASPNAT